MIKSISVLLIKDKPVHVHWVHAFLQRAQRPIFTVEVAGNLASSLERMRRSTVDVLLLDLVLPDS